MARSSSNKAVCVDQEVVVECERSPGGQGAGRYNKERIDQSGWIHEWQGQGLNRK